MEKLPYHFDSVIFDLDGTLWDATGTVAKAWQTANEELNSIKPEQISKEMVVSVTGMTYDAIFEKLFPYVTAEERKRFQTVFGKHELQMVINEGGHLYDDLESTLQYLKTKYRLFIVSNCQNGYIENFLDFSGLHQYFEAHQCFGTKTQPKHENIKDIVKDYNLKAPVYVGDTLGDFEASQKAGVPLIFAAYGFGKLTSGQTATINSFSELTEIL
ncbi:HAD family hydrolase [Mucilaginibacter koreensis]